MKHLKANDNDPDQAFSPDGIDQMNQRITELNEGKPHKPILKVRVYEVGNKFPVGERGNKPAKFVEAAKGTNLYFGIYQSEKGGRNYETISLNVVISLLKCGLSPVPQVNEKSEKLLFYLSPFDLVYVPTEDEIANGYISGEIDRDRIYKMVSRSGAQCFVVSAKIANTIDRKGVV